MSNDRRPREFRERFVQVPYWIFDLSLSAQERMVLITVLKHIEAGNAPSYRVIGEDAGVSRHTISLAIRRLQRLGFLDFSNHVDGSGTRRGRTYTVTPPPLQPDVESEAQHG